MISFKETLGYGQVSEIHNATFTDFHMLYIDTRRRLEWLRSLGMHPLQATKKEIVNHYTIPVWRKRLKSLYLRATRVTFFL